MIGRWAGVVLLAASPVSADVCADLSALRVDFSHQMALLETAECRPVLTQTEGTQLHCNWPFAYRDVAAQARFDALVETVGKCLGTKSALPADLAVNHPDFYDLRQFGDAQGVVAVSIKDKGALQQTYVFLRISGR